MAVSELPGNPNAVWTVKTHTQGRFADSISLVLRGLLVKNCFRHHCFHQQHAVAQIACWS